MRDAGSIDERASFCKSGRSVDNGGMFGRGKRIYLDYASATPVLPEALKAFADASALFANPGGIHAEGVVARRALETSRASIAAHLGVKAREIMFTSGLTESNNLAVVGFARSLERIRHILKGTHWIVSSIEHSSVLECFAEVERMGGEVSFAEPKESGIIKPAKIAALLRPETVFLSVGWGNNEIGTVQPLSAIARALRSHEREHRTRVIFHSDAGQAPLYISPQAHTLGVDLFALGGGKLYGPRGVGCLYASTRADLAPILFGGGQERGLRAGTEEVALAAGFTKALDIVARERAKEVKRLKVLRDELAVQLVARIPGCIVNGDLKYTLPHILNISIPVVNAEYLVLLLDRAGIALSTKSACREGESASHVVRALGGERWRAENTLRISLGRATTRASLTHFLSALLECAPKAAR